MEHQRQVGRDHQEAGREIENPAGWRGPIRHSQANHRMECVEMQQTKIIGEQRVSKIALLGSFRWGVLKRKIVLKWCQLYAYGFRFRERQQRRQIKLAAVLCSLYGHICSQATKGLEAEHFGFAVVKQPDGVLRLNTAAYARMIYTE